MTEVIAFYPNRFLVPQRVQHIHDGLLLTGTRGALGGKMGLVKSLFERFELRLFVFKLGLKIGKTIFDLFEFTCE